VGCIIVVGSYLDLIHVHECSIYRCSINIVGISETRGKNVFTSSEKGLFRKGFTMSGWH
jgi:hypothetical protein